jgi:thiamine biosynthesis lipoprotein
VITHRFRAMGTEIELLVDADDAEQALGAAESEFHRLEALLSRFRPDSQLSRLNEAKALSVHPDVSAVVELALQARDSTGGRFDPTVHDAVVAAGYDRSFELVPAAGPAVASAARCGGGVYLDGDRIELDPDVRLDLGGIGKGFAVERAALVLATAGPCLVNAGGDLAVRGGSWPVGLETADGTITLELGRGAIATSGRDRRRWRRNGREQHHLIDPRTGSPSDSDLLRVTVVAPAAVQAEVWAKALFLAGEDAAAREADELELPSVLVTADGRTRLAGGLG